MTDENDETKKATIQADNKSVAVGSIAVGGSTGDINIHAGDIGYSVEQVSVLITQITSTFQPKPFDGRCPYKGLDYFEEEDAELFFGREKLVQDLVGRVKDSRTVYVTGPSGSGKSSLVRAGLIHTLKQGAIKNSERWLYETMKPGRDPLAELARVASSLAKTTNAEDEVRAKGLTDASIFARWCEIALKDGRGKRVVLFIDQFEEVFTQIKAKEERLAFLNLLTHAAQAENGRVILLFAMRSDFVSNCATYPQLNELLSKQFRQIGAMQPEELVSAIAQPALRVGLRIDPDLVAQIINEMRGEPGALPLMQFALKDLFDSRQEKGGLIALTLGDYLERGGIHKALESHADHAFAGLSEIEQELAHSIFGGLIEIGRGTQDTRRIAQFDELIPANSTEAEVQAVIQKLADARLITTDEKDSNKYTITHERLIEAWPWLNKLVNENRDVIALQNQIKTDAKEWAEKKRDASYLYSGARLINAREQLESRKLVLTGTAQDFVRAGISRQKRGQFILISGIATFIGLLLIAVIVFGRQSGINAELAQRNEEIANTAQAASTRALQQEATAQANAQDAQRQATISRAGEIAAQSVSIRNSQFDLSLLLSIEAFRTADTPQTKSVLLENTQTNQQLLHYFHGNTFPVATVAFSPDGKMLASAGTDILLWNMETYQVIGKPLAGHTAGVLSVVFSADGKILVSSSADKTVILWNVATGQPIRRLNINVSTYAVAFSPDGKMLAGSSDGAIYLWNVATGEVIGQLSTKYSSQVTTIIAFSPDGKTLATGDNNSTITLWDIASRQMIGQPFTEQTDSSWAIWSIAFSPDGKTLASGNQFGTLILWDVATHRPIRQPLITNSAEIYSVVFSPNGEELAAGFSDGTVGLWNLATHQMISQPLDGKNGALWSIAFSPSGEILASGSSEGVIHLWNVAIREPLALALTGPSETISSISFSPDNLMLASGSYDGTITLWSIKEHYPIGEAARAGTGLASNVVFSPNGKILTYASYDNTITLWSLENHKLIGQLHPEGGVYKLSFSSDGKTLASWSYQFIEFWNIANLQALAPPLKIGFSNVTTLSPDHKTFALSDDETITLWNTITRQPIARFSAENPESLAFSPDGAILASGNLDGTIILWDIASRQIIRQLRTKNFYDVVSLAFSPDGKILAFSGCGQRWEPCPQDEIILWSLTNGQPIGRPFASQFWAWELTFNHDGKILASVSENGITLWDVDPQGWIDDSCKRVGRNFSRAEWAQYFPNEQYRATCSKWPLEPEPAAATPTVMPPKPTATWNAPSTPLIDINTSSLQELEALPGIGPTTAQRIIEYRTEHGPFTSLEDLTKVTGIGPGTFDLIKNLITVGPADE
jgi:competence ComEA-like helix-hairpin-helix protein